MSDLMREEFEQAVLSMHVSNGVPPEDAAAFLEIGSNGYRSVSTKSAWWAWQASRVCLVINLPPSIGVAPIGGDGIQEFIDCNGEYLHGHLVVDALTAAGVKYK